MAHDECLGNMMDQCFGDMDIMVRHFGDGPMGSAHRLRSPRMKWLQTGLVLSLSENVQNKAMLTFMVYVICNYLLV